MDLWIISIAIFCVGSLLGAEFHHYLANMRTGNVANAHAFNVLAWFTTAVLALLSFRCCWAGIRLLLDRKEATDFFIPVDFT